jgi:hypothetical protein
MILRAHRGCATRAQGTAPGAQWGPGIFAALPAQDSRGKGRVRRAGKVCGDGATSSSIPQSVPFDAVTVSTVKTIWATARAKRFPPARAAERSGPTDQ